MTSPAKHPPLYILRHGQTVWNAEGRMQGHLDSPLTARGREQALRQSQILGQIGIGGMVVLSSPLGRALETAVIAALPHVPRIDTDPDLQEIDVGGWAGHLRRDCGIPPAGEGDTLSFYDDAPGGEGLTGLARRCRHVLGSIDKPTVLVTHDITGRMLRSLALCGDGSRIADLPGGQGVVHAIIDGRHETYR